MHIPKDRYRSTLECILIQEGIQVAVQESLVTGSDMIDVLFVTRIFKKL